MVLIKNFQGASEKVPVAVYVYKPPAWTDGLSIEQIEEEQENTVL